MDLAVPQLLVEAKILSVPNIIVDLGSTASIITGEDLPIQETQVTGNSCRI